MLRITSAPSGAQLQEAEPTNLRPNPKKVMLLPSKTVCSGPPAQATALVASLSRT